MNYNKVEICGVNTSKLKVLTEKEKRALLTQMKNGTPQEQKKAREELINGNLRLVLSVIQRFTNRGENLDDLFQVGCIGLIKAIDNFDISQDVRFSTYGVPMIIGEILRFLRDNNSVRVSRSLRDTAGIFRRQRHYFRHGSGRRQKRRQQLAGRNRFKGGHPESGAPGEKNFKPALFPGENPDGGRKGNRHFTSAGQPAGKGKPGTN